MKGLFFVVVLAVCLTGPSSAHASRCSPRKGERVVRALKQVVQLSAPGRKVVCARRTGRRTVFPTTGNFEYTRLKPVVGHFGFLEGTFYEGAGVRTIGMILNVLTGQTRAIAEYEITGTIVQRVLLTRGGGVAAERFVNSLAHRDVLVCRFARCTPSPSTDAAAGIVGRSLRLSGAGACWDVTGLTTPRCAPFDKP